MLSRGWRNPTTVAGLIASVLMWFFLAPLQLGGQVSYVILSGNSMEPGFHRGDLVIARAAADYRVGDIVAYHHPDIGVVFHRIVSDDGDLFTLKGDNNTWDDSYSPRKDDILGKYWLFIPKIGSWIADLRKPVPMVLLSLGIGIVLVSIFTGSNGMKTIKRKRTIGPAKKERNLKMISESSGRLDWLFFPGSVFIGALVLGIFAFTRPLMRSFPDNINYQHLGFFGYSANAPEGIYDTKIVQPGEPVFSQISCNVNFSFIYILATASDNQLAGKYQMNAILSDINGWKRTIPLVSETEFNGNSFWTSAGLDLCQLQTLVKDIQEQTGVERHVYSLDVYPDISIQGVMAGKLINDNFAPHLTFQLDPLQMQLSRVEKDDNPLEPVQDGSIAESRLEANVIGVFGTEIYVQTARWISVVMLVLAIAGGLLIGLPIWLEWRKDETARIQIKYAPFLINVDTEFQNDEWKFIEVRHIDDLSKMAERYGAMIMHRVDDAEHTYMVQDGEVVYRYTSRSKGLSADKVRSTSLKDDLLVALRSGQFCVHYQPVVSLDSGDIISVEALARWEHPVYGSIPPAEFIPLAEEIGIIEELDEWVLRTACAQLKTWQDAGLPPVNLSVNLSPLGLKRHNVSDVISEVLDQTQISSHQLQLEVTKSKILGSEPDALENLHDLRKLGVQLAMDEFSSLSSEGLSLNDFSMMKINQEMLGSGYQDRGIADLITAMIVMAQNMKMQVFAKGIETEEQLGLIRAQRFDGAQGYLLSKPLPPEEVMELLAGGIQFVTHQPIVSEIGVDA